LTMTMKRSKEEASQSTSSPSIRLLLHCSDGVVPFLTPALLQKCFPVEEVQDVLMLGLAAKDTCVVPVYNDSNKKEKTKTKVSTAVNEKDTNTSKTKPRGYTFSSAVKVDPWLVDYTRVTVPTFCLLQDALDRNTHKHNNSHKHGSDNSSNSAVTVTSQHVLLWTANGRTPLTPALYHDAATSATGLQSHVTVPLFDTTIISSSNSNEHNHKSANAQHKRTCAAVRRTQDFLSDFLSRQTQTPKGESSTATATAQDASTTTTAQNPSTTVATDQQNQVWAPYLVVDEDLSSGNGKDGDHDASKKQTTVDDDDETKQRARSQARADMRTQQMEPILEKISNGTVTGVVLIGWQHLESSSQRKAVLKSILQSVQKASLPPVPSSLPSILNPVVTVSLLSTDTLQQVLEAACAGVHVIGSRLPTVWAQAKKAFCVSVDGDSWKKDLGDRKRRRLDDNNNNSNGSSDKKSDEKLVLDVDGCVHLNNHANDPTQHPWFHDKRPIQAGCSCLTCRTHSRSYVYHLVCAKELTAEILLFIHNLHTLLQLLREFQTAHEQTDGQALELYEYLQEQLKN
jgi:hypothetical protein